MLRVVLAGFNFQTGRGSTSLARTLALHEKPATFPVEMTSRIFQDIKPDKLQMNEGYFVPYLRDSLLMISFVTLGV